MNILSSAFWKISINLKTTLKMLLFWLYSYWEVELYWNKTYLKAEIDGQSISFQHRIVLDSSHRFFWEPGESSYNDTAVPLRLESHMLPSVMSDPCHPHRSIYMSSDTILVTSDGYRSFMDMRVYFIQWTPPPWNYQEIRNAIMLEDGIIIQIGDGLFWRSHQTREIEMRSELPMYDVMGITQRTICLDDHPQKVRASLQAEFECWLKVTQLILLISWWVIVLKIRTRSDPVTTDFNKTC